MTEIRVNTTVTIGTLSVSVDIEDTLPDPDQFVDPEPIETIGGGFLTDHIDDYTRFRNSAVAALTGRSAYAARVAATDGEDI